MNPGQDFSSEELSLMGFSTHRHVVSIHSFDFVGPFEEPLLGRKQDFFCQSCERSARGVGAKLQHQTEWRNWEVSGRDPPQ